MMLWRLAFRNLFRNKRRSFATGGAVVAGFVGLTLLGGYIYRVERSLRVNSIYLLHKGHVVIYKKEGLQRYATKPSAFQIKKEDIETIKEQLNIFNDKISWIGETLTGAGLLSNGIKSVPFFATGVDLETLKKSYALPDVQTWAKDFLTQDSLDFVSAIEKNSNSISVTKRLADLIRRPPPFGNLKEEERSVQLAGISLYGDLNAVDSLLAVTHTTGSEMLEDSGLLAPIEKLKELYSSEGVHYMMVYLKKDSQTQDLVEQINRIFLEKELPFEAFPFDDPRISPNYVGSMGFLYVMAGFFVFLICGAVALSIVNSLTMGILERTREIGTLRAIGFRPQQIAWMMTQESIWLCILSAGTGTLLSLVISTIVNAADIHFSPPGVASSIQFILVPNPAMILMTFGIFLFLVMSTSYGVTVLKLKMRVVDLLSDAGAS